MRFAFPILLATLVICAPARAEILPATEKDMEAFEEIIIQKGTKPPVEEKKKKTSAAKPADTPTHITTPPEIWAPSEGVRILATSKTQDMLFVSHPSHRRWRLKDQVCVSKNEKELICGEVIGATAEKAQLKTGAVIPIADILRDGKRIGTTENLTITGQAWRRNAVREQNRLRFGLLVGLSQFHYEQSDASPLDMTALSVEAIVSYYLGRRWSAVGEALIFAVPISTSGNPTPTRLFELGLGARYVLRVSQSVALLPQLTYQYETLFTSNRAYGYRNIEGPRLALAADFALDPSHTIRASARGTIYNSDTARFAFGNRKLTGALSYFWDFRKSSDKIGLHVEYSSMNLSLLRGNVHSTLINTLFSYAF